MNDTFGSVNELLDFAIGKEEEASKFYGSLAERTDNSSIKELFLSFSKEELKHKAKLEAVKEGKIMLSVSQKIQNLRIADYLAKVDIELNAEFDFQKALIVAMQREKASFKLYTDLAAITDNPELEELLLGLAQEEAKHKLYFEIQYDEHILTEN
ncbi:ferritin family protein [bacterium]|nr:ferritin family protein [bacterium]